MFVKFALAALIAAATIPAVTFGVHKAQQLGQVSNGVLALASPDAINSPDFNGQASKVAEQAKALAGPVVAQATKPAAAVWHPANAWEPNP
jgi:hypothetical protein